MKDMIVHWIQLNGGLLASVVAVLSAFNVIMSAIQTLCNKLKITEPGPMQKAASAAAGITAWLTANVPTPQPAPTVEDKLAEAIDHHQV